MFKNVVYVQPYYFWKGHYKKYFDSIANKKLSIRSGVEVKSYILNYNKNYLTYSFSRILNNLFCILYLLKLIFFKKKKINFIKATEKEVKKNPPSRSAKLRYAIRNDQDFVYPEMLKLKFRKYLDLESING